MQAKTKIQAIHFHADQKLLDLVHKKIEKLAVFHNHIISIDVFLKLDKASGHANKLVEISLAVPHANVFFAKDQKTSFEEALSVVVHAIEEQLKRHKGNVGNHKGEPSIVIETDEDAV